MLPHRPPEEFAPLSWEHLEEMSLNHVEIGCHTRTHPILSKIPVASLKMEILDAKLEIEKRLGIPVTSFCYPNSRIGDINDHVVQAVRTAGFKVAVFGQDPDTIDDRYRQPRIGACRNLTNFEWKLDGYEILQQIFPGRPKVLCKVLTN
jgi:peptidoglycan/xylan/chitin deacetylase (PgdA/CDA1 family)